MGDLDSVVSREHREQSQAAVGSGVRGVEKLGTVCVHQTGETGLGERIEESGGGCQVGGPEGHV